ncbi:helix-turn-helix domain-containing protein [Lactobacillus sp. XV13L]|nr:helix-turn-helix domain-containing protein [Lactobacillus sp. XV13L]
MAAHFGISSSQVKKWNLLYEQQGITGLSPPPKEGPQK